MSKNKQKKKFWELIKEEDAKVAEEARGSDCPLCRLNAIGIRAWKPNKKPVNFVVYTRYLLRGITGEERRECRRVIKNVICENYPNASVKFCRLKKDEKLPCECWAEKLREIAAEYDEYPTVGQHHRQVYGGAIGETCF